MTKTFRVMILSLFFMPMVALGVLYFAGSFEMKELPILGDVPYFSLEERSGKTITKNDLDGKVWVASFLFTHCPSQCPLIAHQALRVQKALVFKERFRMLSISLDPERDTPEVLRSYAEKVKADPYKWLFARGEWSEVQKLIKTGFRLAVADKLEEGDDITHSSKLVLVDNYSRIRGYYDAEDDAQIKRLIKDAKLLLRGAP